MNTGKCEKCQAENSYTDVVCRECGGRLPWADAIVAQRNQAPSAQTAEQERLAARLNTGMDQLGLKRDNIKQAAQSYANSPEFKAAAAKEAAWWTKFTGNMIGCFGLCVVLLILLFIVVALTSR